MVFLPRIGAVHFGVSLPGDRHQRDGSPPPPSVYAIAASTPYATEFEISNLKIEI
jgi:hypothetical protein